MNVYIRPERPRDDGIMGPELGPFEAVQITYDLLRRCPDGEVIMGRAADGDWYFDPAFGDPNVPYSDIVIFNGPDVVKPTYMTDQEYVAANGCQCPVCRSKDIENGETDMGGSHATQECSCNGCESTWVDVYKLIGYDQLSDNTPEPEDAP